MSYNKLDTVSDLKELALELVDNHIKRLSSMKINYEDRHIVQLDINQAERLKSKINDEWS